jgi:GNAT superfamily N-acetyltransferase
MDVGVAVASGVTLPQVRMAVHADRQPLWELMTMLHGENGLFSISPGKVDQMLDRYYNRERTLIGVIGDVGAPVAAIYLEITQPVYSDDWMLCEQFNFVHPDHRKSNYAHELIAYAKRAADELKLPLMIGILSNKRTEAKMRLYDRMLDRAGGYYIYGLEHAEGAQRWEA